MRRALSMSLVLCACTASQATSNAPPTVTPARPAAAASSSADADAASESRPETNDFVPRLLEIAGEYQTWGRVDDETRWAPTLCLAPQPATARVSASSDQSTHGQKLYFVFARHRDAYARGTPAADQVLVKESWLPIKVDNAAPNARRPTGSPEPPDHLHAIARTADGRVFRTGERAGLFIMYKLDPATPGTDIGWVYGTISPQGEVTSAGRVASCMRCHEKAPRDRLFGVPPGR